MPHSLDVADRHNGCVERSLHAFQTGRLPGFRVWMTVEAGGERKRKRVLAVRLSQPEAGGEDVLSPSLSISLCRLSPSLSLARAPSLSPSLALSVGLSLSHSGLTDSAQFDIPAWAKYRGTSLIKNTPPLGPYNRTMPRALRWSVGGAFSYERGSPVD